MKNRDWGLLGLGIGLIVLITWPLAASPLSAIPGRASLEATEHLWLLWLGAESGGLRIDSRLVAHPDGFGWLLGDPLNLLWFVPGTWIGGTALGFNLVHVANLAIAAMSAVWLGHELLAEDRPSPRLTLVSILCVPALCGGLFTGMTEAQTVGWAGLGLAAIHRAIRLGGLGRALLAGTLCGLTAWAGPYPFLHLAILAPMVALVAWLRVRPDPLSGSIRLFRIVGPTSLLALPVAMAIIGERDSNQPGASDHSAEILSDPSRLENLTLGADPLQMLLPTRTSHDFEVYLGTLFLVMVGFGCFRLGRRALALLIPALVAIVLSMGLYVHWAGHPIGSDGAILAPAGWLTRWFEDLGRAPRWYRMTILAALLLAPLAAKGVESIASFRPKWRRPITLGLTLLLLADGLFLAPIDWPRPLLDAKPPSGITALEGPLLELPLPGQQSDGPPPQEMGIEVPPPVAMMNMGALWTRVATRIDRALSPTEPVGSNRGVDAYRSRGLLWQTQHGQAIGTNPFLAAGPEAQNQTGVALALDVDSALRENQPSRIRDVIRIARDRGYEGILFYPGPHSARLETLLRSELGEPAIDEEQIKNWPFSDQR